MGEEFCLSGYIYPHIQVNGQRITGPAKNWTGPVPDENLEIYVGRIPREIYENELLPLFASIGPIYRFRLMMSFSGMNRGFGYLLYCNAEDTKRALTCFRGYQIRPNQFLFVRISENIRELILGQVNPTMSALLIQNFITQLTGAEHIVFEYRQNYRCAILYYKTHREAALARRVLMAQISSFGPTTWLRWNKDYNHSKQHLN